MSNYKHGHRRRGGGSSKLYNAWANMIQRCHNPNFPYYKDYGGRGIKVCKRWHKFENFAADMGPHPGKGLTLDRENNNKNYCKSNCRWATRKQQANNRRGQKLTRADVRVIRERLPCNQTRLAAEFGVGRGMISAISCNRTWIGV